MAGGGVVSHAGMKAAQYEGRVTVYVVFACIVAASGGLLFGYDIGISGSQPQTPIRGPIPEAIPWTIRLLPR